VAWFNCSKPDLAIAVRKTRRCQMESPPVHRAHLNRRLDCVAVFHNNGNLVGDFRKTWKSALITAWLGKKFVHD
jgi:hypothetical protein